MARAATDDLPQYDVVVVGAGIAGLTTAWQLEKKDPSLKILVLEAGSRVGGRTLSVRLPAAGNTQDVWDMGAQWVGPTQGYVLRLAKELGLETYEQFSTGQKLAQIGANLEPRMYEQLGCPAKAEAFTPAEKEDFAKRFMAQQKLVQKIQLGDVFQWREAADLDDITFAEWARHNTNSVLGKDAADIVSLSTYGVPANKISMLYHLYTSKTAGSFVDLIEATESAAQTYKIKGGTQQISLRLAASLTRTRILYETAVSNVDVDEKEGITTLDTYSTSEDGGMPLSFRARRVVFAIAPGQCGRIQWSPRLPEHKRQIFRSSNGGNLFKCFATFERPVWREAGFSGEIFSIGRSRRSDGRPHPIVQAYDATTAFGKPAIVAFLNPAYADCSREQRQEAVLDDLTRFFGSSIRTSFLAYVDKNWQLEEWIGGCPVGMLPPGMMHAYMHVREPFHNVHFAGTETAVQWIGYMSGAAESGFRAANECLLALGRTQLVDWTELKHSAFHPNYSTPRRPIRDWEIVRDEGAEKTEKAAVVVGGKEQQQQQQQQALQQRQHLRPYAQLEVLSKL